MDMRMRWYLICGLMKMILNQAEVVIENKELKCGSNERNSTDVNSTNSNKDIFYTNFPDSMVLTIFIKNDSIVFNLAKIQDFNEVPIIMQEINKMLWNESEKEQLDFYSDVLMEASFGLLTKRVNGEVMTEYYGIFVYEGIKFNLIPLEYHKLTGNTNVTIYQITLKGSPYIVYEIIRWQEYEKIDIPDNPNSTSIHKREKRAPNIIPKNLVIDLLVIFDYSIFNKWLQLNNFKRDETISRIRYYLAHIINGVNNVYASMEIHKLSVSVVGIFIAETQQQSWFTEDTNVRTYSDAKGKISLHKALNNFHTWILSKTISTGGVATAERFLPGHDIAAAFTDYHESPTEGLAYIGTVCSHRAQGIIHEKGQYDTITLTAHELGHVLGCNHDDDPRSCPPEYHFLMSPMISSAKLENRDKFSTCSINYFLKKINELELLQGNCLDSTKKFRSREDLSHHLKTHPGLQFGPDQQCQLNFGNDYKYCSEGRNTHQTICNKMMCASGNQCFIGHPIAMDGTKCGKGMWCMKGFCVSGAPVTDNKENCFYGDKAIAFSIGAQLVTCRDLIANPNYCDHVGDWCCDTCDKIKRNQVPQTCVDMKHVVYMGQTVYCSSLSSVPAKCYVLDKYCCQTCARIKHIKTSRLGAGCPYGDRDIDLSNDGSKSDCSSALRNPKICFNIQIANSCCESCAWIKYNG